MPVVCFHHYFCLDKAADKKIFCHISKIIKAFFKEYVRKEDCSCWTFQSIISIPISQETLVEYGLIINMLCDAGAQHLISLMVFMIGIYKMTLVTYNVFLYNCFRFGLTAKIK